MLACPCGLLIPTSLRRIVTLGERCLGSGFSQKCWVQCLNKRSVPLSAADKKHNFREGRGQCFRLYGLVWPAGYLKSLCFCFSLHWYRATLTSSLLEKAWICLLHLCSPFPPTWNWLPHIDENDTGLSKEVDFVDQFTWNESRIVKCY